MSARQEVGFRLLFASACPDDTSFANAVSKFGSWHGVVEGFGRKAGEPCDGLQGCADCLWLAAIAVDEALYRVPA